MTANYLLVFSGLGVLGLVIMILGLRVNNDYKRAIETFGALVLHVGVFGILYHKVSPVLFIALVTLMLSLFVLIDPLKIATYVQPRAYRAVGLFLLFASIAFSTMYVTRFPVWLWAIPMIAYLLPHAIPPWKPRAGLFHFCAWLLVLVYMSLAWYSVYNRFYPNRNFSFLTDWFTSANESPLQTGLEGSREIVVIPMESSDGNGTQAQAVVQKPSGDDINPSGFSEKSQVTAGASPESVAASAQPDQTLVNESAPHNDLAALASREDGPFLKGLRDADEQYVRLKKSYDELKDKYDALKREADRLKSQNAPAASDATDQSSKSGSF